jgi:hypothetical protein
MDSDDVLSLEVQDFIARALGYVACDYGWDCFQYESESE